MLCVEPVAYTRYRVSVHLSGQPLNRNRGRKTTQMLPCQGPVAILLLSGMAFCKPVLQGFDSPSTRPATDAARLCQKSGVNCSLGVRPVWLSSCPPAWSNPYETSCLCDPRCSPAYDLHFHRLRTTCRRSPGGRGGERFNPVIRIFDANQDGTLSSDEMAGAAKILADLDKSGDGTLTADELREAMPFDRGPGMGGPGGPPSGRPGRTADQAGGSDFQKAPLPKDDQEKRLLSALETMRRRAAICQRRFRRRAASANVRRNHRGQTGG